MRFLSQSYLFRTPGMLLAAVVNIYSSDTAYYTPFRIRNKSQNCQRILYFFWFFGYNIQAKCFFMQNSSLIYIHSRAGPLPFITIAPLRRKNKWRPYKNSVLFQPKRTLCSMQPSESAYKTKTRRPLPRLVFLKRRRKTERLASACIEWDPPLYKWMPFLGSGRALWYSSSYLLGKPGSLLFGSLLSMAL